MMLGMQQQPLPPKMDLGHHVVAQGSSSYSAPSLSTSSNPSSQTSSQSCAPSTIPVLSPISKPGKPKLSLNTNINLAQTRSFGKGSTSLRLDTLSAVSPTIRNTFSNAYEPQQKSSSLPSSSSGTPVEVKRKPILLRLEVPETPLLPEPQLSTESMAQPENSTTEKSEESSTSGTTSSSSSSTVSPESGIIPYSLPTHHRSILINSFLPKTDATTRIRRMSKPFFPAQKRVTFRDPLDEEVKTAKHVLAHWDLVVDYRKEEEQKKQEELAKERNLLEAKKIDAQLVTVEITEGQETQPKVEELPSPTSMRLAEFKFPPSSTDDTAALVNNNLSPIIFSSPQTISSSSSPSYSPILTPAASTTVNTPTHDSLLPISTALPDRTVHHQRHLKRDSSSSNSPSSPISEENDSDDSCVHTPVAGRCKKRRMWVWTLGPLEGYDPISTDEVSTAPESLEPISESKNVIENVVEGDFVMVEKNEE